MAIILPQMVDVKINGSNCRHFREKGYKFKKCGDVIKVHVLDLLCGSKAMVKCKCDYCGKEIGVYYRTVVKNNEKNKLICCTDQLCMNKQYKDVINKKFGVDSVFKIEEIRKKVIATNNKRYGGNAPACSKKVRDKMNETNLSRYGVKHALQCEDFLNKAKETWKEKYGVDVESSFQIKEVKEKIKQTNIERYGVENAMQNNNIKNKVKQTNIKRYGTTCTFHSKEIQEKIKQTNIERYGVENVMHNDEIKNRVKQTNIKRYGTICTLHSKEIQEKVKQTNIERYGVENVMHNDEIRSKALSSCQHNGNGMGSCSKQQKYIQLLTNGTLNKVICGHLADICIEDKKIVIEYDGSGHFLGDKLKGYKKPTKEAILREKQREDKIINKGYRMIRFIASKDRIPSDEVILNLINGFADSKFNVIRIDLEEGIIDRDYQEKWYCKFGNLRKIKNEDLNKFGNQQ